jgi:hypothetical protein
MKTLNSKPKPKPDPVKQLLLAANFDWSDFHIFPDGGTQLSVNYPISPEEFLTFAKADVYSEGTRGLVNALSNAKRAIDCQANGFITAIGLDPDNLKSQLGAEAIELLGSARADAGIPLKFKFLQALSVATPTVVARIRRLRNDLEHGYRKPSKRNVDDSIGIAELFVQACKGRMRSFFDTISFGSGYDRGANEWGEINNCVHLNYKHGKGTSIVVRYWPKARTEENRKPSKEITVRPGDSEFFPLLKLIWNSEWDRDMSSVVATLFRDLGVPVTAKDFRVSHI